MSTQTASTPPTRTQLNQIDAVSARLGLPSEAQSVASHGEAQAVLRELATLKKRLCWRS